MFYMLYFSKRTLVLDMPLRHFNCIVGPAIVKTLGGDRHAMEDHQLVPQNLLSIETNLLWKTTCLEGSRFYCFNSAQGPTLDVRTLRL